MKRRRRPSLHPGALVFLHLHVDAATAEYTWEEESSRLWIRARIEGIQSGDLVATVVLDGLTLDSLLERIAAA